MVGGCKNGFLQVRVRIPEVVCEGRIKIWRASSQ